MKVENENRGFCKSPIEQDKTVKTDYEYEDELFELDEEMLRILAEPTEAEELYQQMVKLGEVEQVNWNEPESVLRYCLTMYQIHLKIYGDDCPLQPPPSQRSTRELAN